MIIGLLLLGSAAGMVAGAAALIAGQSLLVAFMVYASVGLAGIFGVIALCAVKTYLAGRAALPPHPHAPLPDG